MSLTIGEKIALLRKKKNISQTELAEYLFLAPQTVSRWEVGGGAPDIALLPKIAAFFGVSIDELFGLTSLERTENLVCKYSVLRDDRSFQEAMEAIGSQLQTIDALQKNGGGEPAGLERDRDRLEAEKAHMWIQQGREAFRRAFAIADRFVRKTEGRPGHPWYLPMRLQRDQLCGSLGRGREVLAERRAELAAHPDGISLLRCLSVLDDRQDYEQVLSAAGPDSPYRELLLPPSGQNLSAWHRLIHAAAEMGDTDFLEQHLPPVLAVCGKEDELEVLLCLLEVYQGERLAAVRARLRVLLPEVSRNEYFKKKLQDRIEGRPEPACASGSEKPCQ